MSVYRYREQFGGKSYNCNYRLRESPAAAISPAVAGDTLKLCLVYLLATGI